MAGGTLRARWSSKVENLGGQGCWLWTGCRSDSRYGNIRTGQGMSRAHRVAWELFVGPIPEGMYVLHKCDVPQCVNPDHLFLGTLQENMRDMVEKGRHWSKMRPDDWIRGERSSSCRLTFAHVTNIKLLASLGANQRILAEWFGVSRSHVEKIVQGKARIAA